MMDFYTLTLSTTVGDFHSSSELWMRKVLAAWVPRVGESIAMLTTTDPDDDLGGDVHTDIVSIYYDWDGAPNVKLQGVIIDPTEQTQERNRRTSNPRSYKSGWYTDRDGDLVARLRASGWLPYAEFEVAEKARARR